VATGVTHLAQDRDPLRGHTHAGRQLSRNLVNSWIKLHVETDSQIRMNTID
jgi:hypothetical protein